jgi:hypothetical protein
MKAAIVGASGYSGEELVRLLLRHPQAELAAVTSRQYAGQTVARVFPKFGHDPRAKTLRFSEPQPELLAKMADVVFLALPHGVAAEYATPLLDLGCQVIDLSADFRLKSQALYKEFYGHDHPAPELLPKAVYGLPEVIARKSKTPPDRFARMLSDQHSAARAAFAQGGAGQEHRDHCRFPERRQRGRTQSGVGLSCSPNATRARGLTAFPSTGTCRKSRSN